MQPENMQAKNLLTTIQKKMEAGMIWSLQVLVFEIRLIP